MKNIKVDMEIPVHTIFWNYFGLTWLFTTPVSLIVSILFKNFTQRFIYLVNLFKNSFYKDILHNYNGRYLFSEVFSKNVFKLVLLIMVKAMICCAIAVTDINFVLYFPQIIYFTVKLFFVQLKFSVLYFVQMCLHYFQKIILRKNNILHIFSDLYFCFNIIYWNAFF